MLEKDRECVRVFLCECEKERESLFVFLIMYSRERECVYVCSSQREPTVCVCGCVFVFCFETIRDSLNVFV